MIRCMARWSFRSGAMVTCMLLAACGTPQSGPREASIGGAVVQSLRGLIGPKPVKVSAAALRSQITPALLSQLSGSVLLSEINGAGAVMAQDGRNGAMITYIDSGRIGVSLVDGIVVGTRGLGNDLMTSDVGDLRARMRSGGTATRINRRMTGENGIVVTSFECELSQQGNQVTEACYGPSAKFENTYLLDRAGQVAASRQWLGPETGYGTFERIR